MCGIAGILNLDGHAAADTRAVWQMTQRMRHRGPDDEGFVTFARDGQWQAWYGDDTPMPESARRRVAEAANQLRTLMSGALVINVINLGLTIAFVGYFELGAVGSALGTAVTSCTFAPVLHLHVATQILPLTVRDFLHQTVGPGMLPFLVCIAIVLPLKMAFVWEAPLRLGLVLGLVMIGYGLLVLRVASHEDRADMRRIYTRVRSLAS